MRLEGRDINGQSWWIISYSNSSGDGLSLYCEKNEWLYSIDIAGINDNNREIINKIVDSIQIAEG